MLPARPKPAKENGMASATVENYLKQILLLREDAGENAVALGKLSARMNVSPGTATTMAQNMARAGWLRYRSRAGVTLTPKGEKLALQVLRKHRLVEMFLVSALRFDMSEVHAEAEMLEHAVSEKLLARIDAFLGNPQFDPHGDPIPAADGTMTRRKMRPLAECAAGDRVCISWIQRQDDAFLRYILESGLAPGNFLIIESADLPADAFVVRFDDGKRLALGGSAARAIQTESDSAPVTPRKARENRNKIETKTEKLSEKTAENEKNSKNILLNMNEIKLF